MIIPESTKIYGNLEIWTSATITSGGIVSAADFRDYNFVGSRALVSDSNKSIVESSVTSTQIGYLSTTSANIQNQLTNLSATKADKTTTITAGTGLTGGGDLTTNRTISMPNVGTAGTYTKVSTDAQGRVSAASNITSADLPQIGVSKIGSGVISDLEFSYLDTVSANIQSQLSTLSASKINTVDAITYTNTSATLTSFTKPVVFDDGAGGNSYFIFRRVDENNNDFLKYSDTDNSYSFFADSPLSATYPNAKLVAGEINATSLSASSTLLGPTVSVGSISDTSWLKVADFTATDSGTSYKFETTLFGGDWNDQGVARYVYSSFDTKSTTSALNIRRCDVLWDHGSNEIYSNIEWKVFRRIASNGFEIYVRGKNLDYFTLNAKTIRGGKDGLIEIQPIVVTVLPTSATHNEILVVVDEQPVRMLQDSLFVRDISKSRDYNFQYTSADDVMEAKFGNNAFFPSIDNKYSLGSGSNRWANLKTASAEIGNISATTITVGSIDNTEFSFLNGTSANIQNQLSTLSASKQNNFTIAQNQVAVGGTNTVSGSGKFTFDGVSELQIGTSAVVIDPTIRLTQNPGVPGGSKIVLGAAGTLNDENSAKIYFPGQRQIGLTNTSFKHQRYNGSTSAYETVWGFENASSSNKDVNFYGNLLTISAANPRLVISAPSGNSKGIRFNDDGTIRWYAGTLQNNSFVIEDVTTNDFPISAISGTSGAIVLGGTNNRKVQLTSLSTSAVVVTDGNKNLVSSPITTTELSYLDNVSSNIQTQLSTLSATKTDKTTTITAGTGLTGGGDLTTNRTISLATTGTAGTYTKVTTNAYGQVTFGTYLDSSDLPNNIDAVKIADGTVNNTEFQHLNGISANIQTQINQLKQQSISGVGSGTVNRLSKFTTTSGIGDSNIADDGSTISFLKQTSGGTATFVTSIITPADLATYTSSLPVKRIEQTMAGSDQWRIYGEGSSSDAGSLFIETGDNGNEPINLSFRNGTTRTTSYTFLPTSLSAPSVTATFGGLTIGSVDSTEISHLNGVTSNIQTQLNGKRADLSPASSSWFQGTPTIGSDGVMEIGKYIDFHASNTTTADYDIRLEAFAGSPGVLANNGYFRSSILGGSGTRALVADNTGTILSQDSSTFRNTIGAVGTNAWNDQAIEIAAADGWYFGDVVTGDLAVRFGNSSKRVVLGVYDGIGNNKAAITYSKDSVGVGYILNLTTSGIKFPDNAFGGSGDSAGMRLVQRSGEEQSLELYVSNDNTDWINLIVPEINGAKVNGNTIWNAGNFTPNTTNWNSVYSTVNSTSATWNAKQNYLSKTVFGAYFGSGSQTAGWCKLGTYTGNNQSRFVFIITGKQGWNDNNFASQAIIHGGTNFIWADNGQIAAGCKWNEFYGSDETASRIKLVRQAGYPSSKFDLFILKDVNYVNWSVEVTHVDCTWETGITWLNSDPGTGTHIFEPTKRVVWDTGSFDPNSKLNRTPTPITNTNANSYHDNGIFVGYNVANAPNALWGVLRVWSAPDDLGDQVWQEWRTASYGDESVWKRGSYDFGNNWTAWRRNLDTSIDATLVSYSHTHTNISNLNSIDQNLGSTSTPTFAKVSIQANPVGVYDGSTMPPYFIGQSMANSDGWKIYGEGPNNSGRLVLEVNDDADEGVVIKKRRTYGDYATNTYTIWHEGNLNPNNYSLTGHSHNVADLSWSTTQYNDVLGFPKNGFIDSSTGENGIYGGWSYNVKMFHSNDPSNWQLVIASDFFTDSMAFRRKASGTWQDPRYLWHTGNFSQANINNWNSVYSTVNATSASWVDSIDGSGSATQLAVFSGTRSIVSYPTLSFTIGGSYSNSVLDISNTSDYAGSMIRMSTGQFQANTSIEFNCPTGKTLLTTDWFNRNFYFKTTHTATGEVSYPLNIHTHTSGTVTINRTLAITPNNIAIPTSTGGWIQSNNSGGNRSFDYYAGSSEANNGHRFFANSNGGSYSLALSIDSNNLNAEYLHANFANITVGGLGVVRGSGTAERIPRWVSSIEIGNSSINETTTEFQFLDAKKINLRTGRTGNTQKTLIDLPIGGMNYAINANGQVVSTMWAGVDSGSGPGILLQGTLGQIGYGNLVGDPNGFFESPYVQWDSNGISLDNNVAINNAEWISYKPTSVISTSLTLTADITYYTISATIARNLTLPIAPKTNTIYYLTVLDDVALGHALVLPASNHVICYRDLENTSMIVNYNGSYPRIKTGLNSISCYFNGHTYFWTLDGLH